MDRRKFLASSGLSLIAVTALPKRGYSFLSSSILNPDSCIPTTADILGPFYRVGAPVRTNLQVVGDPGVPLIFKGAVLDKNCNPVNGAIVDVWHANDAGAYDNTSPDYNYRGIQITGSTGEYEFLSIAPGRYLNGSQYRPAHIHFRVTAPGFTELITQLYFQGDPYIPADPWASDPNASLRIVPVQNVGGTDTAIFDITLNGFVGLEEYQSNEIIHSSWTNEGLLTLSIENERITDLEVFDVSGRLGTSRYKQNLEQIQVYFPKTGVCFARIKTVKGKILVHKLNP